MAMTKCKECGKGISTTAKTCPHCGASTSPVLDAVGSVGEIANSLGNLLIFIGVIIIAAVVLTTCAVS